MTDVLTGLPSAAWYPDPARPDLLRWWDGSAWSVHTMALPDEAPAFEFTAAAPMPPESSTVPSAPDLPPVLHTVPQSIPEPMPFANGVSLGAEGSELRGTEPPILTPLERAARAEIYAKLASSQAKERATPLRPTSDPFGDFSNSARMNWTAPVTQAPQRQVNLDGPLSSTTLGVWLLVLWPTVGGLTVKFLLAIILSLPGPGTSLIALNATVLSYLLIPFIFTSMDRTALGRIGHVKRPRGWWLFTTWLGYLIARTAIISRRSSKAFVPLLVFVLIGLATFTINLLTSPDLFLLLDQSQVEQTLASSLQDQTGVVFDVDCPRGDPLPYTCHGVGADGSTIDVEVSVGTGGVIVLTPTR